MSRSVEKSRTVEDATDRTKPWQLSEILDPVQCRSVTMPDNADSFSKVCWLLNLWDCHYSIAYFVLFSALMLWFVYIGCTTSIYKFCCWYLGPWFKWCPEALEMGSQWTESYWEGSLKQIKCFTHVCVQSFIFVILFVSFSLSIENRSLKFMWLQATASVVPQRWQPNSGLLMTNDIAGVNLEEAVPCIALSKNDSYVMSACGGKVSLFNMMTFKVCFWIYNPDILFSSYILLVTYNLLFYR